MKTRPTQPEVIYHVNVNEEKLRETQEALVVVTKSLHRLVQRESEVNKKLDVMLRIVARLREHKDGDLEVGGDKILA